MKLQVVHRTHYSYAEPVTDSFNEARLQPTSADGQNCSSFILKVLPSTRLSHYLDFYLNYVQYFEVPEPHSTLTIESVSTVSTVAKPMSEEALGVEWKRMEQCVPMEKCYDFLQSSNYVALTPEVWRLALDAIGGETDAWKATLAVMRFIHRNFTYTPLVTNVNTHMLEVVQQRRGVCQDFAHVMLGMCRALKIPARYVSGYLYNGPAGHFIGSQASHAWCEVFLPEIGWRALDPTNNQQVDQHYVKVAVGKDYADIIPVKGHYKGTPNKKMTVDVKVTLLNR